MKLLLDQCLPRSAAGLLRDAGIDAVHTGECGLSTAADSVILDYARDQDRVIVTFDSDFHALLALTNAAGPSTIRIRIEGLRAKATTNIIRSILKRCRDDLTSGVAISVTEKQIRLRNLPIGTRQ
jgi:predicted nuclease of predicted toxin-antitoxin system